MSLQAVLLVFLGSGLGGVLRYLVSHVHKLVTGGELHFVPILLVNLVGSFCIGVAFGFVLKEQLNTNLSLFLLAGVLGGFTTYSSFSLDILRLLTKGEYLTAGTYIISTLFLCTLTVFLGFWLAKA